eukprot:scaffold229154_cov27-Prasinocladus_malaysianus.AAC.1
MLQAGCLYTPKKSTARLGNFCCLSVLENQSTPSADKLQGVLKFGIKNNPVECNLTATCDRTNGRGRADLRLSLYRDEHGKG